jgi:predicted small metal-binding protein
VRSFDCHPAWRTSSSRACDCGWTARGTDVEIVLLIQAHAREVHGVEVTPEQALAQARPVVDER